jgi:preprotein translocase subunit Sec61beta
MHYLITWLTQPVQISLTPQTIITASALVAAIVALITWIAKPPKMR